ncbi:hypothetical protein ACU686_00355 [Yinghuangia aomiensis]
MPVAPAPALDRRSLPFHRGPVRGSAARLGGELRDEWLRLTASPLAQLRRRGLRAVPPAVGRRCWSRSSTWCSTFRGVRG